MMRLALQRSISPVGIEKDRMTAGALMIRGIAKIRMALCFPTVLLITGM